MSGRHPDRDAIHAAQLLLARLGISPEDLLTDQAVHAPSPTLAEYVSTVSETVTSGTRQVYGPYWNRALGWWAQRRLDSISASEIAILVEHTRTHTVTRRNARGGHTAAEHQIAALRCIYRHAVADGILTAADNPALKVSKPRRLPSPRHALTAAHIEQVTTVAASTGDDPSLDALLLRFHIETASRREGALALRPADLDREQSLVLLREKGDTVRWQPVSPTLMTHLYAHAQQRGDHNDSLFRYRTGKPIGKRRYDYIWRRLGQHLPWVATHQVTTHWLRHTTLTWVERNFGYAVARAYAGHNGSADAGSTKTYVRASVHEVATALSALTGEPHPLAH